MKHIVISFSRVQVVIDGLDVVESHEHMRMPHPPPSCFPPRFHKKRGGWDGARGRGDCWGPMTSRSSRRRFWEKRETRSPPTLFESPRKSAPSRGLWRWFVLSYVAGAECDDAAGWSSSIEHTQTVQNELRSSCSTSTRRKADVRGFLLVDDRQTSLRCPMFETLRLLPGARAAVTVQEQREGAGGDPTV